MMLNPFEPLWTNDLVETLSRDPFGMLSDTSTPWSTRNTLGRRSKGDQFLATDIFESPTEFCIQVDLPGVDSTSLDVTVANGFLNVKAERKKIESTETMSRYCERPCGVVQRSIPLPVGCNEDHTDAKFENGVLTVTLGKKEGILGSKKLLIKEAGASSASSHGGSMTHKK